MKKLLYSIIIYLYNYYNNINNDLCYSNYIINNFNISIKDNNIIITNNNDKLLFNTTNNFLSVGYSIINPDLIINGNLNNNEKIVHKTTNYNIENVHYTKNILKLNGYVWSDIINASYTIDFYSIHSKNQLAFDINIKPLKGMINKIYLTYVCEKDETFHGFGTQYTYWNLKGKRIPIIISEQGIGRGKQPITSIINLFEKNAGGDWSSSYAPKPLYITNYNRSVVFENNEIMFFDLQNKDKIIVEIIGNKLNGRIINRNSVLGIISEITLITGRMKVLPNWTQEGAIIGLEGGNKVTNKVTNIVNTLLTNKIKITGIWLQDWVGIKQTFEGDRLCWCWTLNTSHYTDWDNMTTEWFNKYNIRTLSYINPYFSIYNDNILHQEGSKNNYFIKNNLNKIYDINSGSIKYNMIDLTNPDAKIWIKNIIKNNMIKNTGVYGWMADFGEHVPIDAKLFNGNALDYHNTFPLEWVATSSTKLDNS
jgi:alpha-glucosidase